MVKSCSRAACSQRGFSLLELLLGITVLGTVLMGFSLFLRGQVGGMNRSKHLAGGTQIAVGALERAKNELADSARFASKFSAAATGSVTGAAAETANGKSYEVVLTYDQAAAPLYALRVHAQVKWSEFHSIGFAVLVPGPNQLLQ